MANLKKDKIYFSILAVGVILIVFALVNKNNKKTDMLGKEANQNVQAQADSNLTVANVLEGVLRPSDDLFRGNLKLVSQYNDIYIRTARDFSSLIGLEVLVKINGPLDKFELLDIQPRVAKDGYILQQ